MLRCSLKFSLVHFNNKIEKKYIEKWRRNSYLLITFSFSSFLHFVCSKSFPLILSLLKSHIQIVFSCFSLSMHVFFCVWGTTKGGWGKFSTRITNSNFYSLFHPLFAIYFSSYQKTQKFSFSILLCWLQTKREKHLNCMGKKEEIKVVCNS